MEKMKVLLTKGQINNLKIFLDRVEFKGRAEAFELAFISQALDEAVEEGEE